MKSNWQTKKLGEICDVITDGTHQTPKYYNDGTIFLSSKNVTTGKINWNDVKYIDQKQHQEMHKRVSPRLNDILLAKNGTTGIAAIVDRDEIFDIYVSLALLRTKKIILPQLLLYFINSPIAKKQFNKRLKGIGVPNLHLEEIKEVKVNFPESITQQQGIIKILDEAFEKIDKAKENFEKNLINSKKLFKSFIHEVYSNPNNNSPKKTLGEISIIKGGKRIPKGYKIVNEKTNHPYIRVTDFNDYGSVDLNNIRYINDEIFNQIKNYTISSNDLYISIAGTIGKTGIVPSELDGANLTENACKLCFKQNIDPKYIYYFTKGDDFINQTGLNTRVSAMPKLALSRLCNISLCIPENIIEQKNIVKKLDELSEKTKKLEGVYKQKIVDLDELKKSILNKAFSGEL